jgi:DNA-binding CsgD family transcriptional regulator
VLKFPVFFTERRASSIGVPLTQEESILMRALIAGNSQKQICKDLRIDSGMFYRLLRGLREKTGAVDKIGLEVWGLRQAKNGDQRTEERNLRYIPPVLRRRTSNLSPTRVLR